MHNVLGTAGIVEAQSRSLKSSEIRLPKAFALVSVLESDAIGGSTHAETGLDLLIVRAFHSSFTAGYDKGSDWRRLHI